MTEIIFFKVIKVLIFNSLRRHGDCIRIENITNRGRQPVCYLKSKSVLAPLNCARRSIVPAIIVIGEVFLKGGFDCY